MQVWADIKSGIKKKMSHNKKEFTATGGGQNKVYSFSRLEESVASLLSLEQMVNPSERVFGLHSAGVLSSNAGTKGLVEDLLVLGTAENEDIQINITSVEKKKLLYHYPTFLMYRQRQFQLHSSLKGLHRKAKKHVQKILIWREKC